MEEGYLSVVVRELMLELEKPPAKDLTVKLEIEIQNAFNVYKWVSNGESKFTTSLYKPLLQSREDQNERAIYLCGFNALTLRTTFIDLNNEVLNGLSNAKLQIRLISVNENSEPPVVTKAAKGVPPPVATPSEEMFLEVTLPLHSVLQSHGSCINIDENNFSKLTEKNVFSITSHSSVIIDYTSLCFDVTADNCLAEYALACKIFRWETAQMNYPPVSWSLHAADVIDPKAKVQPTAADLRGKYLDAIAKLVDSQSKVATYTVTVGGEGGSPPPPSEDEDARESEAASIIQQMMPNISLSGGSIAFDRDAAASVGLEDDIRSMANLWTVSWGSSGVVFLHRSEARRLTALIQRDPTCAYLPVTVKKSPSADSMAAEGGEQFATGLADISALIGVDVTATDIVVSLQGGDFEGNSSSFMLRLTCTGPLVPKSALQALSERSTGAARFAGTLPPDVLANKHVSSVDVNVDAVGALRDEIRAAIERVAQEYVSLYPIAAGQGGMDGGGADANNLSSSSRSGKTLEGRKAEFLSYLSNNGIFHELREKIKGSVQQILYERCGARGRAAGKSAQLAALDMGSSYDQTEEASQDTVESVLSELYVFLMKECSVVLNALFSETVIDKQAAALERSAPLNDEEETNVQQLRRLAARADDTAADGRFEAAESLHLEAIHFVNSSASLGSSLAVVHDVYSRYGRFLLTTAAASVASGESSPTELLQRAREALSAAVAADHKDWKVSLLYAGVLFECGQQEQGEEVMHQVLAAQLGDEKPYSLSSFQDLDGYDSDQLCPVDPRCYSVLAAIFSLQGHSLKCRKALRLANRCFGEGGHEPHVSSHGSPRRTVVLTLADTALFMLNHSLRTLGGECAKLAAISEEAVTNKAVARGKVATTVPHIRHLLKLAQATNAMICGNWMSAIELSDESQLVADTATDKIRGLFVAAQSHGRSGDNGRALECYLRAAELLNEVGPGALQTDFSTIIPLEAFLSMGKLLVSAVRYEEALSILLFACTLYSSASLFLLVGLCYLRSEQLADAEDALTAANVLDNRNSEIWAYLCLLTLSCGIGRVEEAEKCLGQALRLGLVNAVLLRELATAYIAMDKLQVAEDLVRRSLAAETRDFYTAGKRASAHTRRLLGDVLAGQNQAVRAIEAYQAVLAGEGDEAVAAADTATKLDAAEKCAVLLASIGREEELRTLRSIIATLSGGDDATASRQQ